MIIDAGPLIVDAHLVVVAESLGTFTQLRTMYIIGVHADRHSRGVFDGLRETVASSWL
jgi:hypothetical protein